MTNPIQISENCWKHIYPTCIYYRKTSSPHSEIHREDGPALECADGHKEWYYNDQFIDVESQEEFEIYVKTHYPEIKE